MKQKIRKGVFYSLLFFGLLFQKVSASSGSANSNGDWNNPNIWLFGGSPRTPIEGDTVTIPAGIHVGVPANITYATNGLRMGIQVYGYLEFQTGKKLSLPCLSFVNIYPGGHLEPGSGGGNSTFISVCGTTEWSAGDGPLTGPASVGNSTFPVVLMDFKANYYSGKVFLDWVTSTEINNDYFSVQRSDDNKNYQELEKVRGVGNSSETHFYSSVDPRPLTGINYYRLCQVDFDGTRTYSYPVVIKAGAKNNIIIYPNPSVSGNISILFTGSKEEDYDLEMSNLSGRIVLRKDHLLLHTGVNKLFPDHDIFLSQGTYFISVMLGDETIHQKVVIH